MTDVRPLCDETKEGSSIDNPIIIDDDKWSFKQCISKQDDSDGDTEPLSTPEFEAYLGDRDFHVPQGNSECPVTDSTSGMSPPKLTHDQGFDSPESEPTTCTHIKEERSKAAKTVRGEESGAPQNKTECCFWTAEAPTFRGQLYFSRSNPGDALETPIKTRQPNNDHPSSQQRSGKCKRRHEGQDDSGNRRSKRLANKGKG